MTHFLVFLFFYYVFIFSAFVSDVYFYKKDFLIDLIPFVGFFRVCIEKFKDLD